MKTLTKNLVKRSLSVLLVLMMVFSLLTVGMVSTSAAEVELAETGQTFNNGDYIYIINFKPDGYQDCWIPATNGEAWAHMWDSNDIAIDIQFELYDGTAGAEGAVYRAKVTSTKDYVGFIITRNHSDATGPWNGSWKAQTGDMTFDGITNCFSSFSVGGSDYNGNVYKDITGKEKPGTLHLRIADNTNYSADSYIYMWEAGSVTHLLGPWNGTQIKDYGSPDSEGYYTIEFEYGDAYGFLVNNKGGTQTGDSANYSDSEIWINLKSDGTFEVVENGGSDSESLIWADVDGDASTSDVNDRVYVEPHQEYNNCYMLYLPAGVDATELILKSSDGANITVNNKAVTSSGTEYDASSIIPNPNAGYTISGDLNGTLYIRQSANVPSIHTITEKPVPMKEAMNTLPTKDNYESENTDNTQFITFMNADKTLRLDNVILDKIKGRGNSSWKASNTVIGKYAFNITLEDKTNLLGSGKSKKYCLVSYNADQARMRNMVAYDLANEIGLEFSPKFEPVDFYNNGRYIGSYLLTDKVEIGEPLVNLDVDLDKENEKVSDSNKAICKDPTGNRKAGYINKGTYNTYGGTEFTDLNVNASTSTGYFKYVNLTEPDASLYQNSGFLLEFELNDRFVNEISGFISNKGQQIVCKYPENATKNQMLFIMGKWNEAEDIIYNGVNGTPATYEQLDRVIDVESFAKMYLLQELSKNVDAGSTSYYVYYHDGKLHAGVAWDYDWAFGQYTENGESAKTVANQTMEKFKDADGVATLDKTYGWWANSREIYPNLNKLNVQAQLCQNENFWKVVKAEWNEIFYNSAKSYVTSSAISSSTISAMSNDGPSDNISSVLSGKIKEYYDFVHLSTLMDEYKWELIADNPLEAWKSADTGETHNQAVANLNNWIYNRLEWMNTGATTYHLQSTDYTIQPPVLSLATDMPEGGFEVGTEVVINIDDKTGGSYTYTIYQNGEEFKTTTEKSFEVIATSTEDVYTVKATSKTSGKVSEESEEFTVQGSGYAITPSLKASSSAVLTGDTVTLTPSIEEDYTGVDYKIYYKVNGGEAQLLSGITYTQSTAGTVEFYVSATVTVDGETVTATTEANPVKVTFSAFSINVTATNNGSVMQSQNVTITATPSVEGDVTYTFYKDDEVIEGYENVTTNTYTEKMDDAGSFVYKVVAKYGEKIAENTVTVTVTEFDGTFTVKVLFKSSTVYAYRPNMKINGVSVNINEDTAIEVNKVGNGISTYRWYSYTLEGEQTYGTPVTVEVEGNRDYFYKASYTFEVGNTEYACDPTGGISSYYLALDNLNNRSVSTLSNISDMDAYKRNWTESATHMVYNSKLDGELSAPVGFSFRFADYGDANCDGKINIKDATYVQKSLANIVVADNLSTTVSDFNKDGKVTIKDATAIQKQIAGL